MRQSVKESVEPGVQTMFYNILALDQSSRITGYAIFRNGELYSHGKFEVTDDDVGKRLNKIRDKIAELIADFDIDEVILEDIYMDNHHVNNVSTFKILAEVFGVIYELATELGLKTQAILAGTWKSTCGVKGKTRPEQKRNAQQFVIDTYNIKATQDECDAICIGYHVCKKNQSEMNWE